MLVGAGGEMGKARELPIAFQLQVAKVGGACGQRVGADKDK